MLKIPLKPLNMNAFPDHGMRFGRNPRGYYITIDDINSCYTKVGISLSEQLLKILRQTTDSEIIKVKTLWNFKRKQAETFMSKTNTSFEKNCVCNPSLCLNKSLCTFITSD